MRTLPSSLLLLFWASSCLAFPSHLTETTVGCMTELDTSEVIMNNPVVAFSESSDKSMYIDLAVEDSTTATATKVQVGDIVHVSFRNPNHHPDVQYVMEVTEGAASFEAFEGRCEHRKRVAGKSSSSKTIQHALTIHQLPLNIWAGWATGHEAVQLTDMLVLGQPPITTQQFEEGMRDAIQRVQYDEQQKIRVQKDTNQEQQLELEQAEAHERADVVEELGDDSEADMGDLSHNVLSHSEELANDIVKQRLEKLEQLKKFTKFAGLPKAFEERMKEMKQALVDGSNEKKEILKAKKDNPPQVLDIKDKRLAYLEKMKGRLDPDKYEQMKARMVEQFDRRDSYRKSADHHKNDEHARHHRAVLPHHEVKQLEESLEENLQEQAKKNIPLAIRERLDMMHLHDKRWAERLAKANGGVPIDNEQPSPQEDDTEQDDGATTPIAKLLQKYEQDHDMDMRQFMYAAVFFILSHVVVIQLCLCTGRREKGRREQ